MARKAYSGYKVYYRDKTTDEWEYYGMSSTLAKAKSEASGLKAQGWRIKIRPELLPLPGTRRRNPAIKLPANFTPAEVRVNEQGKVQIRINPAKVGRGRTVKGVQSVQQTNPSKRKTLKRVSKALTKYVRGKNPRGAGVGFTLMNGQYYELIREPGQHRVQVRGTYPIFYTKTEAAESAKKIAAKRKLAYLGEVEF